MKAPISAAMITMVMISAEGRRGPVRSPESLPPPPPNPPKPPDPPRPEPPSSSLFLPEPDPEPNRLPDPPKGFDEPNP